MIKCDFANNCEGVPDMLEHKIEAGMVSDFMKVTGPADAAKGPGAEELYYLVSTSAILDLTIEGSGKMLDKLLPPEYTTVGTFIEIYHEHPTLVGEPISIRIKIDRLDGAKIFLGIEGFDNVGRVFKGNYERHIVNKKRLMEYAYNRSPGNTQP